ncbi:Nucleotide-binding universal stress protein, UspA family [Natronoarchaeum philippinense]|uniref:Nucleotide-binding universal stress protein, UspA family n=1 Tax=Natronoarchaeum philippinense TaxID=558529 RepID=A0A285N1A6_NATPI|nr:universal stress protein [Natronoarchaeum philippinense]SNZ03255.1 Nucleotide-binding universal stress protein, UspA family [Natronoarchaeum philippinense]
MPDTILVPVDGSPLSFDALEVALSEHTDAEIIALHVIDPTEPGYSYPVDLDPDAEPLHGSDEWMDRARELESDLFEDIESTADEHDAAVQTETSVGDPRRVIVDYAEREGVDAIVMGSHGREEGARILLGSVTEAVAFRSPVRVTLVR